MDFQHYMCASVRLIRIQSAEGPASVHKMQMSFYSFKKHLDTMSPHFETIKKQTPKGLAA